MANKLKRRKSIFGLVASLFLLTYTYSIAVYIIPLIVDQPIDYAFDAFAYAKGLNDNEDNYREVQRFLFLYPDFSPEVIFLYAPILHILLLIPSLYFFRQIVCRDSMFMIFASIALPESMIFLSAISKEGLAIIAVVTALAGITIIAQKRNFFLGLILCAFAIVIAEISRPLFGLPFAVAIIIGFTPLFSFPVRRAIYFFVLICIIIGLWSIIFGPYADSFLELYQNSKKFLDWFETEMASDSVFKSFIRGTFSAAFSSDEPTLITIFIILLAALLKTIIYTLAIPLISLPNYSTMPALTWALTWQIAASLSSFSILVGFIKLIHTDYLSTDNWCRLWFGLSLMFLIALSTPIFHVRYRAPAVVALLLAINLVHPNVRKNKLWMSFPTLIGTTVAILNTI